MLVNKSIAIVGAGPGGLTLARLLQLKGFSVTVYERDANEHARPKGATLDLHDESGLRAIREAGLTGAFTANYRPGADKLRVVDENATIFWDDHLKTGEATRPEIDRGPLQKILLDSLQPGTVRWDHAFVRMQSDAAGWNLEFTNGDAVYADIVVGADGANSKVRPWLTTIRPFYTGYTAVEGAVYDSAVNCPDIDGLLEGGKIFAFGDSKSLIVSSKGDGSLVFYPCFKAAASWVMDAGIDFNNRQQVVDWFIRDFPGWSKRWRSLFEQASGPLIPRPIYSMPLDQHWPAQSNLTLLGDAAHLMPPYAGEGVNMAMLDAVQLCHCLTDDAGEDPLAWIARYEKEMRARASVAAAQSIESLEALHAPDAIEFMLGIFG